MSYLEITSWEAYHQDLHCPGFSLVTLKTKSPKQQYKDAQGILQPAWPDITSSVPMAFL